MYINSKCKICRRAGQKLFLKGERCSTPKCSMIKKPYPPGKKGKRRVSPLSEYGKELREKQKLKNWYGLREIQLKKYVKEILKKKGRVKDAGAELVKKLETRLDNVIFRLGFTNSRSQAKQLVGHGYFLVNGKEIDIPSYHAKKEDKITIRQQKIKKKILQHLTTVIKKYQPPSWLQLNKEKLEGKIISYPTLEEAAPPAELSSIFEFYSR